MEEQTLLRVCRVSVLIVAAATILATVEDYGVSWDESTQLTYGTLIVSYFRSCGTDLRANEFSNLRYYGPGLEPLSAWLALRYPAHPYVVRHLVSAGAMLLTFAALLVVGALMKQAWIGVLAAMVLALMPLFWGHGFVNSKDIPVAMGFSWFMAALVRLVRTGRGFPLLGVALGITLECRPGMLPLLVVFVLIGVFVTLRARSELWSPSALGAVAAKVLFAFATGWVFMVALWPWAQGDVLWHPLLAIWHAVNFAESYPVLFAGTRYDSQALPWFYLIWHFIIGMPLVDVALLVFGSISVAWGLRDQSHPEAILLLAWVILPIGLWTVSRSNIYDGMRHLLFVLPGAALIIASGVCALFGALVSHVPTPWAVAIVGALLLAPLPDTLRLHPYEMTFLNSLSGGMAGAEERYETDYWLTSYKEAMEWIDAQAGHQEPPVRVLVAANDLSLPCAAVFKSERVEIQTLFARVGDQELPGEYDYYLATTRYGLDENFPATPVVHAVGRLGATFSVVKSSMRGGDRPEHRTQIPEFRPNTVLPGP